LTPLPELACAEELYVAKLVKDLALPATGWQLTQAPLEF
jgi:hypothetical protein